MRRPESPAPIRVEDDAPMGLLESGGGICQARLQAAAARHWQKGKLRESLHATALDGVAKAAGNVGAGPKRHRRLAECRTGFRRSEEHTSELQSLMRISYAVFCLKKKKH